MSKKPKKDLDEFIDLVSKGVVNLGKEAREAMEYYRHPKKEPWKAKDARMGPSYKKLLQRFKAQGGSQDEALDILDDIRVQASKDKDQYLEDEAMGIMDLAWGWGIPKSNRVWPEQPEENGRH